MDATLTSDIIAALAAPFPIAHIEIKPGAVKHDGSAALALAYADWRVYAERLDAIVGPANWSIDLAPWGDTRLIARLTICGITKAATGEGDPQDTNCGTIAEAQAKKRACAEFGLGRYLYNLPTVWGSGKGDRKAFAFDDPRQVIWKMYHAVGLPTLPTTARPAPVEAPTPAAPPAPEQAERLTVARTALADATARTRTVPPSAPAGDPASDAQWRLIESLRTKLRWSDEQLVAHVEEAGASLDTLTKRQASGLIEHLRSSTALTVAAPARRTAPDSR